MHSHDIVLETDTFFVCIFMILSLKLTSFLCFSLPFHTDTMEQFAIATTNWCPAGTERPLSDSDLAHHLSQIQTMDDRRPHERHSQILSMPRVLPLLRWPLFPGESRDAAISSRGDVLRRALNILHEASRADADAMHARILTNLRHRLQYERIDASGPRKGRISRDMPMSDPYFTVVKRLHADDCRDPDEFVLANNGWVFNGNPLVDFASSKSDVYLARDVIIWGDCVKLRYGGGPKDNPWLWEHMAGYARQMASVFHAFRIGTTLGNVSILVYILMIKVSFLVSIVSFSVIKVSFFMIKVSFLVSIVSIIVINVSFFVMKASFFLPFFTHFPTR